jgi:uncharacterized protein with ParB-like and HNH nuclease domain
MKTDKITIFDLFEKQRRYLVPIFQRGYVWKKESQWEPLWDDICDQIKLLQESKGKATHEIRKHFLGAIVLNQVPTVIKQLAASEIIDGQQRLLTIQIILVALRDVVADLDDEYLKANIERLTLNPGPYSNQDEQYKVWPTNAYQEDLRNIIETRSMEELETQYPQRLRYGKWVPPRPALVDAYFFFARKIRDYLSVDILRDDDDDVETIPLSQEEIRERANNLYEAVRSYIQLVEIQLDYEDEPQVIFETLNARGIPLEPSDLIRNYIFLEATRQNKDVNALYQQWWKDYDDVDEKKNKFWKEQERQGRFKRSRLDLFFFHYLTFQILHEIKMNHMYQEFKDWWESAQKEGQPRSIELELEKAQRSSRVFRSLVSPCADNQLGIFATRLQIMDTTTVYPLLLLLCEKQNTLAVDEFNGILQDLESYLIRRQICGLTTKNYNRFFLSLLNNLSKRDKLSRELVQRELLSSNEESTKWPDNELFRKHLTGDPIYLTLSAKRVQMILKALELASRTSNQEESNSIMNTAVTVEHVMPQSRNEEEWPYPKSYEGIDALGQLTQRYNLIHNLGNLTLLTQYLNSEVSNASFRVKRPEIAKQSLLILNSYFQRFSDDDVWNEETILERGKHLADLALTVWEYPKI